MTESKRRIRQAAITNQFDGVDVSTPRRVRQPINKAPEPSKEETLEEIEIPSGFRSIIESRRKIDPEKEWSAIRDWLEINGNNEQEIRAIVRESANMQARAKDLYSVAKREHRLFEIRYKESMQLWRREAWATLEKMKKEQQLSKQITESMIEDQIIEHHALEYADLEERMCDMTEMKNAIKELRESVISKGFDNRKLLESERRKAPEPNWFDSNG